MNIRMTEQRERRLRELMQATGENTKSKALDVAIAHYLRDLEKKQAIADDLSAEQVEALSTAWLPIERPDTLVGREHVETD